MKPALVISDRDNVATALEPLDAGRRLEINGSSITAREPIPAGHKVALTAIAAGTPVIKYGSPIGVASADIAPGAHVHIHNVSSNRGRGDLEVPAAPAEPRLAEPPDDRSDSQPIGGSEDPAPPLLRDAEAVKRCSAESSGPALPPSASAEAQQPAASERSTGSEAEAAREAAQK